MMESIKESDQAVTVWLLASTVMELWFSIMLDWILSWNTRDISYY